MSFLFTTSLIGLGAVVSRRLFGASGRRGRTGPRALSERTTGTMMAASIRPTTTTLSIIISYSARQSQTLPAAVQTKGVRANPNAFFPYTMKTDRPSPGGFP